MHDFGGQDSKSAERFVPSQADDSHAITQIGEGVYQEISGVSRPNELQGRPWAELDWVPRAELRAVSER